MKKISTLLLLLGLLLQLNTRAQEITLVRGVTTDSVEVAENESYAIFLPTDFDAKKNWPVLFVCDMEGRARKVISMFLTTAEAEGYVLVGSNNLRDSSSVAQNILVMSRLLKNIKALIPTDGSRIYAAGQSSGARFASLLPSFIKEFKGVVSIGAPIPNYELLTSRNAFHFIGVVGNQDFNYPNMVAERTTLKQRKFPNQLRIFQGGEQWPDRSYIEKSFQAITLHAMAKGRLAKDAEYIERNFKAELEEIEELIDQRELLFAYNQLSEVISLYQVHKSVDSLLEKRKQLRKSKLYKSQRRNENAAIFKESLMRDEYQYNLLEDIATLNYNNLGWWNYQVGELNQYAEKPSKEEQRMGVRLLAYLNALIEDNIDIEQAENPVNDEVVSYLWMLKTITEPDNFDNYLKIISDSAKYEDFGTALFYLEELLKQGYKDKAALYKLDNTALLRITPEFNELIEEYLKDARYEIIEE